MKRYKVSGMSCAACSARVEKAAKAVSGVKGCSVNLLLGSLTVEGEVDDGLIINAVKAAGYSAEPDKKRSADSTYTSGDVYEKKHKHIQFVCSLVLLSVLMYVSMGYGMLDFTLPKFFDENPVIIGLLQMLLSFGVMLIHRRIFISGVRGVLNKAPNMDTLVSLGSGASFLFGVAQIVLMSIDVASGNVESAHGRLHGLYFESAAMILVLISVGKILESRAKGKTKGAIEALLNIAPKTALVLRDGNEIEIPVTELNIGDVFLVKRGGVVPCDGIIAEGEGAFDESALTGESIPRDKFVGEEVYGGTILTSGFVRVMATSVGENTAIERIIALVKEAAGSKAPVSKLADRVSGVFVPIVLLIAIVSFAAWAIATGDTGYALARGISVLVISCPCALGLATPVSIMAGGGVGARFGILYKTAEAQELCGRIRVVVFDKTGTLTEGRPEVTDVYPVGVSEAKLLEAAAAAEQGSEHPISLAILEKYKQAFGKKSISNTFDFTAYPGGVSAKYGDSLVYGGNVSFIEGIMKEKICGELAILIDDLSTEGKTPILFVENAEIIGVIAVRDKIRDDAKTTVSLLNSLGVQTLMLTGDNEKCAGAVARELGIKSFKAQIFPEDKLGEIKRLKIMGKVCMVGDGVNDAPALTEADVGIAVGRGVDVAIDSADVVIVSDGILDVYNAIRLGRRVLANIKTNLFWAFCYNTLGIPLAAGVFVPWLGWSLSPMFGAAAMSLSSLFVVTNALSLFRFKPQRVNNSLQNTKDEKEIRDMEITVTLKIEGMMCPHCSGSVKSALEAMEAVIFADVSHEKGLAVITVKDGADTESLTAAVEAAGYKVLN